MSLLDQLKDDLKTAMKSRNQFEIKTIRSLIASIENAGAVPAGTGPYEIKIGLNHDVPRKTVTDDLARELIVGERDEYLTSATNYRELGLDSEADELDQRAAIANRYLT